MLLLNKSGNSLSSVTAGRYIRIQVATSRWLPGGAPSAFRDISRETVVKTVVGRQRVVGPAGHSHRVCADRGGGYRGFAARFGQLFFSEIGYQIGTNWLTATNEDFLQSWGSQIGNRLWGNMFSLFLSLQ